MLAKQGRENILPSTLDPTVSRSWRPTAVSLRLEPALCAVPRPGRIAPFQLPHFLKYLLIGALACGIDVGLFLILHNVTGLAPLLAHSVSVPLSVLFSFSCNAALNFRTTDYLALRFLSFAVVAFVGYLTGVMVISARDLLGLDANFAKALSLPLVFVVQYMLNSLVSFRKTAGR